LELVEVDVLMLANTGRGGKGDDAGSGATADGGPRCSDVERGKGWARMGTAAEDVAGKGKAIPAGLCGRSL
jgi:hypothetical protein